MKTAAGIFSDRNDAGRAAARLASVGIGGDDITVLMPGASEAQIEAVPTDEAEQPGMGKAIGFVVGGAVGAAAGLPLGAAVVSLLVPGIGPVIAIGLAGAALLGAGGAAIGGALESNLTEGLPKDEVFVYEEALRQDRTVVIALVRDDARVEEAREVLESAGADSVDAAREQWWVGLSDVDKNGYAAEEEAAFRRGFEAALHRDARGRSFEEARASLQTRYPDDSGPAFRRGYEQGQAYYRRFSERRERKNLRKSA